MFEPRNVVLNSGTPLARMNQQSATSPKFWMNPAVCHSSPFFRQSPFRQIIQPGFEIDAFDEMFEMEIV
jgi:hypothetical protein